MTPNTKEIVATVVKYRSAKWASHKQPWPSYPAYTDEDIAKISADIDKVAGRNPTKSRYIDVVEQIFGELERTIRANYFSLYGSVMWGCPVSDDLFGYFVPGEYRCSLAPNA